MKWRRLYTTGARGSSVSVVRQGVSGSLYVRWWNPARAAYDYRSLRHTDLERAKGEAHELAEAARRGAVTAAAPSTLGYVLARYEAERTPEVGPRRQKEHRRILDRWQRFLGPDAAWSDLPALVRKYERARAREVRPRQVEIEVRLLLAVMRWASSVVPAGGRVLPANPLQGHRPPVERNPRRPVATWEHWLRTYRQSGRVDPSGGLRCLLVLVEALGWRVTALCELRASDVDLTRDRLLKRAETDKMGVERWVPLPARAAAALRRYMGRRAVVGDVWLFPAPRAAGSPWSKDYAQKLHRRAQVAAGGPVLGFHAYRRKWATERKHLPAADVAAAGAWLDPRTLAIYQAPDEETIRAVLEEPRKLRERKAWST